VVPLHASSQLPQSPVLLHLCLCCSSAARHLSETVQGKLEELEKELTVINENSERLKKSQAELVELQLVLEKAGEFFDDARASAQGSNGSDSTVATPLLDDVPVRASVLRPHSGVCASVGRRADVGPAAVSR
jgi:hypothetical protein